jgi:uncharacterized protein YrrD
LAYSKDDFNIGEEAILIMLRSLKALRGYTVRATDGDIGTVDEFYFDDQSWAIRYLVVDTGNWLVGRKVLIFPASLGPPDWEASVLPVVLSRQQVADSPSIEADQPISRQKEDEFLKYYGWPAPGWTAAPSMAYPAAMDTIAAIEAQADESAEEDEGDPHLRSMQEVLGYDIQARDGEIGHVDDFIVDDEPWMIRYMVVDTRDWLPGRQVLVSPTWVTQVRWDERAVHVDLSRETIQNSPEFDSSKPVNREYEERLYDYYGRPKYWERL